WPTEIGLLQGLASQAGAAISNARLYQAIKEAKERLEEVDRLKNDFILPISLDISADMWVLADAERLPMVISNLLTNAGKYAPGSPYRLAVRREQRER